MPPTLRTLCNVYSVTIANQLWVISEGLLPGVSYRIGERTADTYNHTTFVYLNPADTAATLAGAQVANADGVCSWGVMNNSVAGDIPSGTVADGPDNAPGTVNRYWFLYETAKALKKSDSNQPPASNRLSVGFRASWVAGSTVQSYVSVGGLVGTLGDRVAELRWNRGAACEPTWPVVYRVWRNNTPYGPYQTARSFHDAGLTNGISYSYKVEAVLDMGATTDPAGTRYIGGDIAATNFTGTVTLTPRARREYMGLVAR